MNNHVFIRHEDPTSVNNAIDFIKRNLHRSDLSIEEVAASIYVSERTLFRMIKQHLNQTPYTLIRDLRLAHANQILSKSLRPNLKRVATSVGYSRVDHFVKLYKQKYEAHPISDC